MSVGWDVKWCPVSRITTSLVRKRPFHWISMKSRLVRAAMETSKFQNWSHFTNSRRRYMAEILPIRRNSIQSIISEHFKFWKIHRCFTIHYLRCIISYNTITSISMKLLYLLFIYCIMLGSFKWKWNRFYKEALYSLYVTLQRSYVSFIFENVKFCIALF